MVPMPTAVGEVRACLWVRRLFVYIILYVCERTRLVPPPPCWGCSISWLQVLLVRSLPAGSPLCAYPWAPVISCPRAGGNYRKQDEHPGREGSRRVGRGGRRGDDPGDRGEDHGRTLLGLVCLFETAQ